MFYQQFSGKITSDECFSTWLGYSGHGEGKNNPAMQKVPNVGPIPVGKYTIGQPYDSPQTGPFTLPLTPDPENEMFGRSGFKIHGDNLSDPGNGSDGCIVVARDIREKINNCNDKILNVV
jgi:hypothetical protein